MRKKSFLLLLMLLIASVALSGCSLVVKDAVKDAAQVILNIGGDEITKGDFLQQVSTQEAYSRSYYAYYAQLYQSYGLSFGVPTEAELHQEAVTQVHDHLVEEHVLAQQAVKLNLTLTEEEQAAARQTAETNFNDALKQIIDSGSLGETDLEGDALTEAARKYAEESGVTLDNYVESAMTSARNDKLRAYAVKDVTVTDEEIQNDYTVKVNEAKTSYEEDITAFGSAVNNGTKTYYAPAGYRYVKQILVKFTDEDQAAIDTAKAAVTTAQTALTDAQAAVTANEEALKAEDLTDEKKAELTEARPALDQAVTDAQAALDEANAASQQALDKAFEDLQPTVDEIQQKLAAGEDFDALMEQYGQDPGMQNEPGKTNGYAVCAGFTPFMAEFVDAAMALQNVGDVSEPIRNSAYGIHIIRYAADIPEGEAGLDAFRDEISASLLSSKQDETYQNAVTEWTNATDIKYYPERLDN